MPDKSKVVTQTKRDIVVLQVGGWAWDQQPYAMKNKLLQNLQGNHSPLRAVVLLLLLLMMMMMVMMTTRSVTF
jgi:hypothetical protein